MARGTKLYQQATSPLIEGHSRSRRPSWQPWLASVAIGTLVVAALAVVYEGVRPGAAGFEAIVDQPATIAPPILSALAGASLGAMAGVWLAGRMGWRRRVLAGTVVAIVAGVAAVVAVPVVSAVVFGG